MTDSLRHTIETHWRGWCDALDQDGQWIQIHLPLPETTPLRWLQTHPHTQAFYWSSRDGHTEVAGIGAADVLSADSHRALLDALRRARHRLSTSSLPVHYYGGARFAPSATPAPEWADFGTGHFVAPRFAFRRDKAQHLFVFQALLQPSTAEGLARQKDTLLREVDAFSWDAHPESYLQVTASETLQPSERTEIPEQDGWETQLQHALKSFEESTLQKIVLARRLALHFQTPVSPTQLLHALKTRAEGTYSFLFQIDTKNTFLGATPELLFRRHGQIVESEALAGTRSRGETPEEDEALGRELLETEKEVHEHQIVLEVLTEHFTELCHTYKVEKQLALRKLRHIQHLLSTIHGELKEDVDDFTILQTLHPTPAVGGRPRGQALELIQQLEPFDRGWYAAPVGWFGADAAEFVVGIRSALVQGKQVSLYAGAGIVPGSDPSHEWVETEKKLTPFVELFS